MAAISTSYTTVVPAHTGTMLIAQATSATVLGGSTLANVGYLNGILIVKALTGTLTVAGFFKPDGTTAASLVFPIATPAGFYPFGDAQFQTLTLTKSSGLDDDLILAVWRSSSTTAP